MKSSPLKKDERHRIRRMTREIQSRANYSLALLGMGFVRNGSGKFLNIRAAGARFQKQK